MAFGCNRQAQTLILFLYRNDDKSYGHFWLLRHWDKVRPHRSPAIALPQVLLEHWLGKRARFAILLFFKCISLKICQKLSHTVLRFSHSHICLFRVSNFYRYSGQTIWPTIFRTAGDLGEVERTYHLLIVVSNWKWITNGVSHWSPRSWLLTRLLDDLGILMTAGCWKQQLAPSNW